MLQFMNTLTRSQKKLPSFPLLKISHLKLEKEIEREHHLLVWTSCPLSLILFFMIIYWSLSSWTLLANSFILVVKKRKKRKRIKDGESSFANNSKTVKYFIIIIIIFINHQQFIHSFIYLLMKVFFSTNGQ